jgi:Tfp pilus tip-associated adhesin PilY1
MTDSNPKTTGANSTPNNQNEQNNTTNSFKKEFLNADSAELRLDALKTAFQNQKNGEEEIPGPALAGIIDTTVAEKEKIKVKKPVPKD